MRCCGLDPPFERGRLSKEATRLEPRPSGSGREFRFLTAAALVDQDMGAEFANRTNAQSLNRKKRLVRNVARYTSHVRTKAVGKLNRRITICGNLASWGMDGFAYDSSEPAADI